MKKSKSDILASRKVSCVRCYEYGLHCANGDVCDNCAQNGSECVYALCSRTTACMTKQCIMVHVHDKEFTRVKLVGRVTKKYTGRKGKRGQ